MKESQGLVKKNYLVVLQKPIGFRQELINLTH